MFMYVHTYLQQQNRKKAHTFAFWQAYQETQLASVSQLIIRITYSGKGEGGKSSFDNLPTSAKYPRCAAWQTSLRASAVSFASRTTENSRL